MNESVYRGFGSPMTNKIEEVASFPVVSPLIDKHQPDVIQMVPQSAYNNPVSDQLVTSERFDRVCNLLAQVIIRPPNLGKPLKAEKSHTRTIMRSKKLPKVTTVINRCQNLRSIHIHPHIHPMVDMGAQKEEIFQQKRASSSKRNKSRK